MAKKINNISKNKKQIISDIMNQLININVFDYKNAEDKQLVGYTYKNHYTTNSVINKCKGLCLRDWDFSILRDQAYASIFESILDIANNYTEDELKLIYSDIQTKKQTITNQFLAGIYKKSIFDVKTKLSGHRRDGKQGMIPSHNYVEYTEENLEHIIEVSDDEQELDILFFITWFNQNKESFLTRKQLEFLEDENITKTNKSTYRKRIYEATMKAYKKTFDNCEDERINEIRSAIDTIEELLNNTNFDSMIINAMNKKRYIMDAITTYVDMPTMQKFNKGDRSYEVVKKYRVALFKKLAELNDLLEDTLN